MHPENETFDSTYWCDSVPFNSISWITFEVQAKYSIVGPCAPISMGYLAVKKDDTECLTLNKEQSKVKLRRVAVVPLSRQKWFGEVCQLNKAI